MLVNQIAVFLENRQGRIFELTEALKKANINMLVMSIADTSDYGILRAVTDDNAKAIKTLKEAGFTVNSTDLVGIEVEDRPGGLAEVLKVLYEGGIDIEYLYSFKKANDGNAIILFKVANIDKTIEIIKKSGVKLLEQKLY